MTYYTLPPPPRLAHIVRYFWVLESDQPYIHYSMADVCPELLFHYKGRFYECSDGRSAPSFLSGLHAQTRINTRFKIDEGFGIFGVYLFPQAIPLLFKMPAAELTDQMPCIDTLLKAEGRELEEKMMTAADNHQRVQTISAFIERKLASGYTTLPVFACIQSIISSKGMVQVKQLAGETFLSERQFERQFKQFTGLNPKLFSRIVRFQSAMAQYGKRQLSLTQIAYESGYYDQSHFIHDFIAFSGHHPKHYFSGNSEATLWRD